MAFSYDGRNLPRLTNYAAALRFWERADKWRDYENDRVLDSKRKKYVTIRKLRDESIACRLHNTDVVTFHPDNTMTVVPWRSVSTDAFFNSLCSGHHLWSWFNIGLILVNDKYYRAVDRLKIRCDPVQLLSEPPPFKITTINRKVATEVRKQYRYNEFAAWVKMMAQIEEPGTFLGATQLSYESIFEAIRNQETWPAAIQRSNWPRTIDVQATLTMVRAAIYERHPEAANVEVKPYLTTLTEIRAWRKY